MRASKGHPYRLQVERLQCPELDEVDVRAARHDGVNRVLPTGVRHENNARQGVLRKKAERQQQRRQGAFIRLFPGGSLRTLRHSLEMLV